MEVEEGLIIGVRSMMGMSVNWPLRESVRRERVIPWDSWRVLLVVPAVPIMVSVVDDMLGMGRAHFSVNVCSREA